jgi:hypothetical protein
MKTRETCAGTVRFSLNHKINRILFS